MCNIEHYPSSCKILRDATPRSLVILDGELDCFCLFLPSHSFSNTELGRGTSTYVRAVIYVSYDRLTGYVGWHGDSRSRSWGCLSHSLFLLYLLSRPYCINLPPTLCPCHSLPLIMVHLRTTSRTIQIYGTCIWQLWSMMKSAKYIPFSTLQCQRHTNGHI